MRAAQILEACSELQLNDSGQFASIGRELLKRAREFESPGLSQNVSAKRTYNEPSWDLFISHASEDKELFVRPLAEALCERGFHVWFDEYTLKLGDSLRRSIDQGLSACRFGVVVLSPAFFSKEWPQRELDGLANRELDGKKIILPIWHNLTAREVRTYSPILADRLAVASTEGLHQVVDKIADAAGVPQV